MFKSAVSGFWPFLNVGFSKCAVFILNKSGKATIVLSTNCLVNGHRKRHEQECISKLNACAKP